MVALRAPGHPGPVFPHPTSQAQLWGWPAGLERGRLPRGCGDSTRGLPGPDSGEQPPERRRCAVGGAGNVYGRPFGGPGGERRSRGGPLPCCPLQSLQGPRPAHPRDTYGLAGCLCWGPLGPDATSRGTGGGLRPRGAGSSAPCPRRKGRATARRHLRSRVTFPALPRPPPIQAFLRVPIIRARSRSPRPAPDLTNRWLWLFQFDHTLLSGRTLDA